MAVIRSSSFGKARKSIGNDNYYRRAGVQIVRSKPTFAPTRQFTEPQLLQQYSMKLAQDMFLVQGLKAVSDFCNVPNNRKYNASSRYNRGIKNVLPTIRQLMGSDKPDYVDFWNKSGVRSCASLSTGNFKINPTIKEADITEDYLNITITIDTRVLQSVLSVANKRRSQNSQFTMENIGMCGVFSASTSSSATRVMLPTFVSGTGVTGLSTDLSFSFPAPDELELSTDSAISYSLFITDGTYQTVESPSVTPQWCSDSFYRINFKK